MKRADLIREYVLKNYIDPSRARGQKEITIRAGDVHRAMDLRDAMPAVASALGANKFLEFAGIELIRREGPQNGANLFFTFRIH